MLDEGLEKLKGFNVLEYAFGGDCDEHRGMGQVLVKDYAYIYPGRELRIVRIAIGWVCVGCIREGYARLDSGVVRIIPLRMLDRNPRGLEQAAAAAAL